MKRIFEGDVCEDKTINAEYQRLLIEDDDGDGHGTLDFFRDLEGKRVRVIVGWSESREDRQAYYERFWKRRVLGAMLSWRERFRLWRKGIRFDRGWIEGEPGSEFKHWTLSIGRFTLEISWGP